MKNWLKKQATEFTAWMGLLICLTSYGFPNWVTFTIGIALISIDDERAKSFVARISPWAIKKIDEVGK